MPPFARRSRRRRDTRWGAMVRIRSPRFESLRGALAIAGVFALSGCNLATLNVRAARAYSNEDTDIAVVLDRAEDLASARNLVKRLLAETPYSPGDAWIGELRLDQKGAEPLKHEA